MVYLVYKFFCYFMVKEILYVNLFNFRFEIIKLDLYEIFNDLRKG